LFTDIYVDTPEVRQQQSETSPSESLVAER
jgi:hypothetical protein